ncbi:MAG: DUF3108 domain-containing protein [Gallionella sp.]|nr:DUF3108 domain-containing protein [Gallionella sp.]MDD4945592.1 DUF3108 domain-containing protein [Gallionella sp.]MDD5612883.1 DUF3108 domain-containing protein [Gallionella sp.]
MKQLTLFAIWLALSAQAWAAPPTSIKASYQVFSRGIQIGVIDETYQRDGNHYTLTSTTTPVGLLALFKPQKVLMRSNGLVEKHGLRPLHFDSRREGDPSKDVSAEFDWTARQLTLTNAALRSRIELPEGTQDRLSAMYQFFFLTLKTGGTVEFPMTNGSKLDVYRYVIGSRKNLDSPAGQLDTLYLDNQGKAGENRTELWLSARHYNLPGKMVITDAHGDQFTQVLSSVTRAP